MQDLFRSKYKPSTTPARDFESIKKRSKLVLKSYIPFAACHARIVRAIPSEANVEGYTRLSAAFYNEIMVEAPDDDFGPPLQVRPGIS